MHMHTHNGILSSHLKKIKMLPVATTWIDLKGMVLSEISQRRKTNTI